MQQSSRAENVVWAGRGDCVSAFSVNKEVRNSFATRRILSCARVDGAFVLHGDGPYIADAFMRNSDDHKAPYLDLSYGWQDREEVKKLRRRRRRRWWLMLAALVAFSALMYIFLHLS